MSDSPTQQKPIRVVVIGGGFGGLEFARTLSDPAFQINLVDRRNYHLFQPLLYQVATAKISPSDIGQPIRSLLSKQENVKVFMDEAKSIDLAAKKVTFSNDVLEYDYLVLAMGARTGYFGHDEWEQHAPGMKTLEDATRIRANLLSAFERAEVTSDPEERKRLMNIVIVGGGPTGVEMAGAISELCRKVLSKDFRRIRPEEAKVMLIEGGPRLLGPFPESLSAYTAEHLTQMGVQVRTGTVVKNVGPSLVQLEGEDIHAENIIWAAGVEASPLTKSFGVPVDRGGRIQVSPDCSLPGHPEVFAIGDIVSLTDSKGVRVPGVAPAAVQMAGYAAKIILAEGRSGKQGTRKPFTYFDKGSMATIGRRSAVASFCGMKFTGFIAWLMWLFVHLMLLAGLRNRISVFGQWIYSLFTWKLGSRIITK